MKSGSDMKSGSAMKSGKSGPAAGGNAEQVKTVQQALKDKGHDPGDVDGKLGPKTQQAIRDYQQKEGLKATGRLDTETAAKLGVQAKADTSSATSPAASPSGSSSSGGASGSTSTGAKPSK
jgi:peptidoglycan hydrolase-like protein with peptidoglycan-binding domain